MFYLGPKCTRTNCPSNPSPTSKRRKDPRLRPGQEARGGSGNPHPDPGTDAAQQTGSLLHQVQDTGTWKNRTKSKLHKCTSCSIMALSYL